MSISYSAVILTDESKRKLKSLFFNSVPSNWKWFGHHMTINIGEISGELIDLINKKVKLTAYEIGVSDKAIALKVKGFPSKNKIPHITLSVNINEGGKPKDSNDILKWEPLKHHINLVGEVQEIPHQQIKETIRKVIKKFYFLG